MRTPTLLAAGVLALGLALPASADKVGTALPTLELEGLANSPAESVDDFFGRALLVEFFAYW